MPTRTALPPNANFGLSDWRYWSNGLIYRSTLFLHGVCMLRECTWWVCTRAVRLTLTLTHTITAYSVSGNVVGLRARILICATRQKPCIKRVYLIYRLITHALYSPRPLCGFFHAGRHKNVTGPMWLGVIKAWRGLAGALGDGSH